MLSIHRWINQSKIVWLSNVACNDLTNKEKNIINKNALKTITEL